jgi:hypothetical protein
MTVRHCAYFFPVKLLKVSKNNLGHGPRLHVGTQSSELGLSLALAGGRNDSTLNELTSDMSPLLSGWNCREQELRLC